VKLEHASINVKWILSAHRDRTFIICKPRFISNRFLSVAVFSNMWQNTCSGSLLKHVNGPSPSWKASSRSCLHLLRNTKKYYRGQNSPKLNTNASTINSAHNPTTCAFKICLNVILYLCPGLPDGPLLSVHHTKNLYAFVMFHISDKRRASRYLTWSLLQQKEECKF
jgi:hypothetical protein